LTDLFASREVPVDDIHVLDGPAAPVLFQRVLRPSVAVITFGLEARTVPISGLPDPDIGMQLSSTRHAVMASVAHTQDSGRLDAHTLVDR